jgi:hypothetical protein
MKLYTGDELAIKYAESQKMFVIFGYVERYCEHDYYDYFMFFDADTLEQVFSNVIEYLKKTKYIEKSFEIGCSFEHSQFEFKVEGWKTIKVVNCKSTQIDFIDKEDEFEKMLIDNEFEYEHY